MDIINTDMTELQSVIGFAVFLAIVAATFVGAFIYAKRKDEENGN